MVIEDIILSLDNEDYLREHIFNNQNSVSLQDLINKIYDLNDTIDDLKQDLSDLQDDMNENYVLKEFNPEKEYGVSRYD
jgi:hypothetical protein